jgi:hypothetical protein
MMPSRISKSFKVAAPPSRKIDLRPLPFDEKSLLNLAAFGIVIALRR